MSVVSIGSATPAYRLREGIRRFQAGDFAANSVFYQRTATEPQRPHTLMITCADSRIDIERVTDSRPGELFITRNIGNIVPAYGEMLGGVSAVIEYAVAALQVQHIVVCGHADCGAMHGLEHPERLAELPTVRRWLQNAEAARAVADSLAATTDPATRLRVLTERNVLLQVKHLETHPSVAGAIARGTLTIDGWVYEIGSGEVRIAESHGRFVAV